MWQSLNKEAIKQGTNVQIHPRRGITNVHFSYSWHMSYV